MNRRLQEARKFVKFLSQLEDSKSAAAMELLRRTVVQYLELAAAEVEKLLESGQAKKDLGAEIARESLLYLDELQESIEKLSKLENETFNKELKAKEFRAKFDSIRATADAIRVAVDVEEVMKDFNHNRDITEKVDEGLVLLDDIKRAKNLSKGNKNLFCRNLILEGKIKQNLLENDIHANRCYKEAIDIAEAEGHTEELWYKEATELLEFMKHKDDGKSKAEIVESLSAEIKMLDDAANLSLRELIDFLFKNFPPKHKQNPKKPELKESSDARQKKKAYYVLSSYYHPDKVDTKQHGLKYKVLCEEIAKRINQRFGNI